MSGQIKLGLLDFGYRQSSVSSVDVLQNVIDYAVLADSCGFSSFWMSEHHNSGKAWSSPEMMVPVIAGLTNNISVGVAGVLLPAHSPYRISLNFKLLSVLFPNRIDLGLANVLPEISIAKKLLDNGDITSEHKNTFIPKISELMTYFNTKQQSPIGETIIPPLCNVSPRVFKLCRTFESLHYCLDMGLNISVSLFHSNEDILIDKSRISDFRNEFFEKHHRFPRMNLALAGVCARTNKSAKRTFETLNTKNKSTVTKYMVGSPESIKETLLELCSETGITEFIFYDQTLELKQRMIAIELLSKEFQLT